MSQKLPELQPGSVLHEILVGAFRARGTSFTEWCNENGVTPNNARQASYGQSRGVAGRALRERLIEAAGREFVHDAYFRRLDEHHRQFKKGAA